MHKSIVPSENIGRWLDLDELDPPDPVSALEPRLSESGSDAAQNARRARLSFQPFRSLGMRPPDRRRTHTPQ